MTRSQAAHAVGSSNGLRSDRARCRIGSLSGWIFFADQVGTALDAALATP
jgi:hypothetical protein